MSEKTEDRHDEIEEYQPTVPPIEPTPGSWDSTPFRRESVRSRVTPPSLKPDRSWWLQEADQEPVWDPARMVTFDL